MKKNVLKYFVIILFIIIVLLIINNIRNYMIVSKMVNVETQTRELECNNYYHQVLIKADDNSQKLYAITEEFLLDDKYEERTYISGKVQISNGDITTVKNRIKEGFYIVDNNILKEILSNYILKPIILENNYYVVEFKNSSRTIYINKDSYLIEIIKENNTIQTMLLNVVTENDFTL